MPIVFISYRRDDTEGHAGRLHEALSAAFPELACSMDVDSISPGEDFVEAVDRMLSSCDVMLALIGRNWLAAADDHGRRRVDNEEDSCG